MKSFNLIGNHTNKAGLEKDCIIIKNLLEQAGHQVFLHQFTDLTLPRRTDYSIFLELVVPHCLSRAKCDILIPNDEWYFTNVWDHQWLPRFSKIWCKTRASYDIWAHRIQNLMAIQPGRRQGVRHATASVTYIGWEAADYFNPQIQKQNFFLHLAGRSETKNTDAVVSAWRQNKIPYPLTVVAWNPHKAHNSGENIRHHYLLEEKEVINLLNQAQFHVMCSQSEGFGHAIHEALGCGGIVVTTNALPMREFSGVPQELLVPVQKTEKKPDRLAIFNFVDLNEIVKAAEKAIALPPNRIVELSEAARAGFLKDREEFRTNFAKLMDELEHA
jgi:hypothetical protein